MLVPKAPVNEDGLSPLAEDNIGTTGQVADVQAIPKACGVKEPAHGHLGRCVLRTHQRHLSAAFEAG
jgi:hypothetical protein